MLTDLTTKKCIPFEGGTPSLKPSDIEKCNQKLSEAWQVIDNKKIKRDFKFANFKQAMEFVNQVAAIAEQEQHHPDISISYSKVSLELCTHSINGLSENDYIMAEKINQLH